MSYTVQGWEPAYRKVSNYQDAICPYCGHQNPGGYDNGCFDFKYENSERVYLKTKWYDLHQYPNSVKDPYTFLVVPIGSTTCQSCGKQFCWTEKVNDKYNSIKNGVGTWTAENVRNYETYF